MLVFAFVLVCFAMIILLILEAEHYKTYIEITEPFDSLEVGKIAIFRSDLEIVMEGDFILANEDIWKVIKREEQTLELVNSEGKQITDFPVSGVEGKFVGYERD